MLKRKIDELNHKILSEVERYGGLEPRNIFEAKMRAFGVFKALITSMGVEQKKLKDIGFMKELKDFYNFLFAYDLDPMRLTSGELWELKDFYDVINRFSNWNEKILESDDVFKFQVLLKQLGPKGTVAAQREFQSFFEFYKSMGRYGLDVNDISSLPVDILVGWYEFHKKVVDHYSRVLDIKKMSVADIKELKSVYDIHRHFEVFSGESMPPQVLADWIRFAFMIKKMYSPLLSEITSLSEQEKEKLVEIFNVLDAYDPALLKALDGSFLKQLLELVISEGCDIITGLESLRQKQKEQARSEILGKLEDDIDVSDIVDDLIEILTKTEDENTLKPSELENNIERVASPYDKGSRLKVKTPSKLNAEIQNIKSNFGNNIGPSANKSLSKISASQEKKKSALRDTWSDLKLPSEIQEPISVDLSRKRSEIEKMPKKKDITEGDLSDSPAKKPGPVKNTGQRKPKADQEEAPKTEILKEGQKRSASLIPPSKNDERLVNVLESSNEQRQLSENEKRHILKELIESKGKGTGALSADGKRRWRVIKNVITQVDQLKKIRSAAKALQPSKSNTDAWKALVMGERNKSLWKKLKTTLRVADFTKKEIDKLSLVVGIPADLLAVMSETNQHQNEPSEPMEEDESGTEYSPVFRDQENGIRLSIKPGVLQNIAEELPPLQARSLTNLPPAIRHEFPKLLKKWRKHKRHASSETDTRRLSNAKPKEEDLVRRHSVSRFINVDELSHEDYLALQKQQDELKDSTDFTRRPVVRKMPEKQGQLKPTATAVEKSSSRSRESKKTNDVVIEAESAEDLAEPQDLSSATLEAAASDELKSAVLADTVAKVIPSEIPANDTQESPVTPSKKEVKMPSAAVNKEREKSAMESSTHVVDDSSRNESMDKVFPSPADENFWAPSTSSAGHHDTSEVNRENTDKHPSSPVISLPHLFARAPAQGHLKPAESHKPTHIIKALPAEEKPVVHETKRMSNEVKTVIPMLKGKKTKKAKIDTESNKLIKEKLKKLEPIAIHSEEMYTKLREGGISKSTYNLMMRMMSANDKKIKSKKPKLRIVVDEVMKNSASNQEEGSDAAGETADGNKKSLNYFRASSNAKTTTVSIPKLKKPPKRKKKSEHTENTEPGDVLEDEVVAEEDKTVKSAKKKTKKQEKVSTVEDPQVEADKESLPRFHSPEQSTESIREKKAMKSMKPSDQRRHKPKDDATPKSPSPKHGGALFSYEEEDHVAGEDDSWLAAKISGSDLQSFALPSLPMFSSQSKSRMGLKSAARMAMAGTAKRQMLDFGRFDLDSVTSLPHIPIVDVPKTIWVYEWDLFEPLFTRAWTFSYFDPTNENYKNSLALLVEESKPLGNWLPSLAKIPSLPPIKRT